MPSEIGAAPTCTRMTALPWAQAHSLLPGAHRRAGGDAIGQRVVAGVLGRGDGGRSALALGLVLGDEIDVVGGQRLKLVRCDASSYFFQATSRST